VGKILAVHDGLPWIAVPTTCCGSGMTRIREMKIGAKKRTRVDDAAFSRRPAKATRRPEPKP